MTSSTRAAIVQPAAASVSWRRRAWDVVERGDPMVALGLIWIAMLGVQAATPAVLGIDGYYHIKMAWLIRQYGLGMEFPWLPLTILNPREFTNHHLLYHLLLVPFTLLGDLRQAAKAAALVYGILAILSTYLLMTRLRVRFPLVWLLALLGSAEWFLGRQSMTRRQSVSLAMLMLATYLLVNGRYRWLLPLAFAYAWVFDGYVLLLVVAGIAFLARLLAERRLHWPMLGWTVLGLALSQLLHPYFPNNLSFTVLHVLPKIVPSGEVAVGNEWSPYTPEQLVRQSWLALSLFGLALVPGLLGLARTVWTLVRRRRFAPPGAFRRLVGDQAALTLGGLAFLFVILYLRSRRFIETEPAFAAVFCAYVWTHHLPRDLWQRLEPWAARPVRLAALAIVTLILGAQAVLTLDRARDTAAVTRPHTTLQEAAEWLHANTQPGERVYHTDWDDFPELFFHNTHNTYIVGLDPTYMFLEQPELYRLWRSLGRGEMAQPSTPIRDQLHARWAITDRTHTRFLTQAANDPNMEVAFESPGAVVLRIKG